MTEPIHLRRTDATDREAIAAFLDSLSGHARQWRLIPMTFDRCDAHHRQPLEASAARDKRLRLATYCPHKHRMAGTGTHYCTLDAECRYRKPTAIRAGRVAYPTEHRPVVFASTRSSREVRATWLRWYLFADAEGGLLALTATAHRSGDWRQVDNLTASMWPGLTQPERITKAKTRLIDWIAAGADADFAEAAKRNREDKA